MIQSIRACFDDRQSPYAAEPSTSARASSAAVGPVGSGIGWLGIIDSTGCGRGTVGGTDGVEEHATHKRSYATDLDHLAWLTVRLKGRELPSITTDALLKLRNEQIKQGNMPATANRYLATVSAVISYAHAKGLVAGVPKIPYLPEDSKDFFLWITREQAAALLAELPPALALIARFDLATGLRRANVTGLLWSNIDMERRVMWVWATTAKGKRSFAVPLNDEAMAILKAQRALPATWDKRGLQYRDPFHVFTYRGKPLFHLTTKAWKLAVARVGKKQPKLAIDPRFTFHDLRHTWASWHVMGGTPLKALQELGAWASMDMVLRYAHLSPGYVASFVENVAMAPAAVPPTISPTVTPVVSGRSRGSAVGVGWLMGLEPTTTGITIQDSTN